MIKDNPASADKKQLIVILFLKHLVSEVMTVVGI